MKRIYFLIITLFLCAGAAFAQPRPVDASSKIAAAPANPAPASFVAKYEGGMFGYSAKEVGMLKFDDANQRLVFFGKDQKEKFQIPYKSVQVIYPQSKIRNLDRRTGRPQHSATGRDAGRFDEGKGDTW